MTSEQVKIGFVVCVDNTGYPASLELHKIYTVIHDPERRRTGILE